VPGLLDLLGLVRLIDRGGSWPHREGPPPPHLQHGPQASPEALELAVDDRPSETRPLISKAKAAERRNRSSINLTEVAEPGVAAVARARSHAYLRPQGGRVDGCRAESSC